MKRLLTLLLLSAIVGCQAEFEFEIKTDKEAGEQQPIAIDQEAIRKEQALTAYDEGMEFAAGQDWDHAIESYTCSIELDPDNHVTKGILCE